MDNKYDIKNVHKYIENITENGGFSINNITVEHRSNNKKREYLFVNKSQCKHIPCSPSSMISMCKGLARIVNKKTSEYDSILVVAFAETATAIGNFVADYLSNCTTVIQTTRENVENSTQLLTFEEVHSHATTQNLLTYTDEKAVNINNYDYVLFVDDEISTGNTILNFMKALKNIKNTMHFGVASICNWQTKSNIKKFDNKGIDRFSLLSGEIIDEHAKMFDKDDENVTVFGPAKFSGKIENSPSRHYVWEKDTFRIERLGHPANREFNTLTQAIDSIMMGANSFRVIGTEEFMYMPIRVAKYIEDKGKKVLCHSTTRSSIDPIVTNFEPVPDFGDIENTICIKYSLPSVYDDNRETYLYNLNYEVDKTLFITDKEPSEKLAKYLYEMMVTSGLSKDLEIIILK